MGPRQFMEEYERRLNLHSVQAVEPLISPEAVFWFNDGSHRGLAQVKGAIEKTLRDFPLERYWLEDVVWLAESESAAACVYSFRWSATFGGQSRTGGGRGTNVLRSEGGEWKIVHEHLSGFPE